MVPYIHKGFKIPRLSGCGGSSPPSGTISYIYKTVLEKLVIRTLISLKIYISQWIRSYQYKILLNERFYTVVMTSTNIKQVIGQN